MSKSGHPKIAGFTLVEVVVALAILSISFGVLLRLFSNDLHRTSQTEAEVIATSLSQSLLARIGADGAIADGDSSGIFNNGFTWQLHVAPYGNVQDWGAWSMSAYQVLAQVSWKDGGQHRSISLESVRLEPLAVVR